MKETTSLLRTPRPYAGESLKGLIVRAAEENGYDRPSLILALVGAKTDLMAKGGLYSEHQWKRLSEVLNVPIYVLQDIACLRGSKGTLLNAYNLFGHKINKYSLRLTAPKICPGCLRDGKYTRKIWDLAAFTCCPQHRSLLIDRCPNCNKKISWNRNRVSICSCGQDWQDIVLPKVTEAEVTLSLLILQACGLWKEERPSGDAISDATIGRERAKHNPLSTISLGELLCTVYFIAGQQRGLIDASGNNSFHERLTTNCIRFLVRQFLFLRTGPLDIINSLRKAGARIQQRAASRGCTRTSVSHMIACSLGKVIFCLTLCVMRSSSISQPIGTGAMRPGVALSRRRSLALRHT